MANTDYWVVVYKILTYYYETMKKGKEPIEQELNAFVLGIAEPYLLSVYRNLFDDGFLTGSLIKEDMTGRAYLEDMASTRITTKGIEYLEDNTKMKQVYKVLKEIKAWIPGL